MLVRQVFPGLDISGLGFSCIVLFFFRLSPVCISAGGRLTAQRINLRQLVKVVFVYAAVRACAEIDGSAANNDTVDRPDIIKTLELFNQRFCRPP